MNRENLRNLTIFTLSSVMLSLGAGKAMASTDHCFEVTVTNMTRGQVFTPVIVATHNRHFQLFSEGDVASHELEVLAESGDVAPLSDFLAAQPSVGSFAVSDSPPFGAGESVTIQVPAYHGYNRLSLASMLAITNDGFIALNGASTRVRNFTSPVYDAGTEANDELVANIPGPGGEGYNPADGEGFIHIHAGIQGIGDLAAPEDLDWRNPAAKITSRLVRCTLP